MRSSALIIVVLGAAVAGCATPEQKAACFAVSGWATPTFRCAAAPPPVAVAPPPPEPAKPEPPPEPAEPPKAEIKSENIELSETVQFETDSAVLLDRSKVLLDQVVQALNDHPEVKKVMIEGHTDSVASTRHNKKLSDQRVASVKAYLIEKGIEAGRLKTKGFGETRPIASNKTEEGRAKNRRVDFKILERSK
ncbi:MAG TPA: OmpA family protein [Kofleriaceae bacterium]|nr:OmpA family protein [Kofleriaceae bacterium]